MCAGAVRLPPRPVWLCVRRASPRRRLLERSPERNVLPTQLKAVGPAGEWTSQCGLQTSGKWVGGWCGVAKVWLDGGGMCAWSDWLAGQLCPDGRLSFG